MPMMQRRRRRATVRAFAALVILAAGGTARAEWATREAAGGLEAGTLVDGRFAGLLLRCPAPGRLQIVLTHNGAAFDRAREHTLSLSVDGVATLLPARAVAGTDGDDFVHEGAPAALEPLTAALARGRDVEIAAPSGRYTLPLAGSSRALEAFAQACRTP